MTLNCLIVDDEPLALDLLESYVSRTPFLHLIAQCDSAVKALSVIEEEPIDLVFLDIQMPEPPLSNNMRWKAFGLTR